MNRRYERVGMEKNVLIVLGKGVNILDSVLIILNILLYLVIKVILWDSYNYFYFINI